MPPRSAHADAAEEARPSALALLPLVLTQRIFALLPVDQRARAACVCRTWRDVLADPAMWTRLDLSRQGGVTLPDMYISVALLLGAAGRAHGQLCWLDVSGRRRFTQAELSAVAVANAGSLRSVRMVGSLGEHQAL